MITFAKGHAYGNDFLYVERRTVEGVRLDRLAQEMCERHTGIGADGLIVYERTAQGASIQLFNADGGRAEVSGNGVRALGALLLRDNPHDHAELVVSTDGGQKRLSRISREGPKQTFRASMGAPLDVRSVRLTAGGEDVEVIALNMGNPQAIVLGLLPDDDRFLRVGSALERHAAFPDRTNVEFVQVDSPNRIRIRIWERGVGPTTSSGTGSCAALVAAASFGGASRDADVIAPGGSQRVEWLTDAVYLTGWAEMLCEGHWLRPLPL